MAIAKYRKNGFPKEWFLTDFTMEQVEGRLESLEAENARLREALLECVMYLDDSNDSDLLERIREVLGVD